MLINQSVNQSGILVFWDVTPLLTEYQNSRQFNVSHSKSGTSVYWVDQTSETS